MNNKWTWEQLLVVGGFLVEKQAGGAPRVCRDNRLNEQFLSSLLEDSKIKGFELGGLSPSLNLWVELLKKHGGRPSSQLYKPGELVLIELDIHILGVVRQLNRLGVITGCSCSGHGEQKPKVFINDDEQRKLTKQLLSNLGYCTTFSGPKAVVIDIEERRLFDLAIDLSMLRQFDRAAVEVCVLEKRTKLLDLLLSIPGRSGEEDIIRNVLLSVLKPLVDSVEVDTAGNIIAQKVYGNGEAILLSAHMDVVDSDIDPTKKIIKDAQFWKRESGILGADDRAGIAMIINILKELKGTEFNGTLKIVFTVEEECGQNGAEGVDSNFYKDVLCAISLDRKNAFDIVTHSKSRRYCSEAFGNFFEKQSRIMFGRYQGYEVTCGGISDLRVWSANGIDSVNLSIGYYHEHTHQEQLNILEWNRTLEFTKKCLSRLCRANKENDYSRKTNQHEEYSCKEAN